MALARSSATIARSSPLTRRQATRRRRSERLLQRRGREPKEFGVLPDRANVRTAAFLQDCTTTKLMRSRLASGGYAAGLP